MMPVISIQQNKRWVIVPMKTNRCLLLFEKDESDFLKCIDQGMQPIVCCVHHMQWWCRVAVSLPFLCLTHYPYTLIQ